MRVVALARAHELQIPDQFARVERWVLASGHELVRLRASRRRASSSPAIGVVLDACRQGKVDVVGVVDLTRLATCRGVLAAVLMLLEGAGVRVAVVGEDRVDIYCVRKLWTSDAMAEANRRLLHEERMARFASRDERDDAEPAERGRRQSVISLLSHTRSTAPRRA